MRVLEFNSVSEAQARNETLFQTLRRAGKVDGGTVQYAEPFQYGDHWYLPYVDEISEFVEPSEVKILIIEEE